MLDSLIFLLAGTLAAATPLLFAAMGEAVVEKAGVLNLSIEGMMAIGAATGFAVTTASGSYIGGFAMAALGSAILSSVFAILVLFFLANQVAAGLAVGILGLGFSVLIGKNHEGQTIKAISDLDMGYLAELPFFGDVLFSHDPMLYVGIGLIFLVWWVLSHTRLGLIIRAVGESPDAASAIGYPVILIRFLAILFGGAMAGLGGAYLTLSYTPLWAEGLVAGRGWIVVALVVFGMWRPLRIAVGAYLFGAVSLLELFIQGQSYSIPSQLLSALPYIITIVILVIMSRNPRLIRLNHPASLGQSWHRSA
ncbi:ABC transporter permease [Granulosicoccus sp. 3-233]|uniref:ABC transporter permease n=1 Tax=Granulosicoccus sp. 3-233 TaxID=3417969 RepID=UPI003D354529